MKRRSNHRHGESVLCWTLRIGNAIVPPLFAPATRRQGRILRSLNLAMTGEQAMDLGTTLFTWLRGQLVGTDAFGNRYYRNRRLKRYGRERRWVMYKGEPEASKVPPEWHAWLHHMVEEPLTDGVKRWPWQKEHVPNLSGTPYAYRPKGHALRGGKRPHATGDYEPWTPE